MGDPAGSMSGMVGRNGIEPDPTTRFEVVWAPHTTTGLLDQQRARLFGPPDMCDMCDMGAISYFFFCFFFFFRSPWWPSICPFCELQRPQRFALIHTAQWLRLMRYLFSSDAVEMLPQ